MTIKCNVGGCHLKLAFGAALCPPVEFNISEEISPQHGEAAMDISVGKKIIADLPCDVCDVTKIFTQLVSNTGAILNHLPQFRLPQQQQTLTDTSPEAQPAGLRDKAHTTVGELHDMYESICRVTVWYSETEPRQGQAITAKSGGR